MEATGHPELTIVEANTPERIRSVAKLVASLLRELTPNQSPSDRSQETEGDEKIARVATTLLNGQNNVWALLAESGSGEPVGVLTLNQSAAIYAGGPFGEISELYVTPACRSARVGEKLLEAACSFARNRHWTRLEVGAPEMPAWARTVSFYKAKGFREVGPRLKCEL